MTSCIRAGPNSRGKWCECTKTAGRGPVDPVRKARSPATCTIPGVLEDLQSLPPATWPRAALFAVVAAVVIAIPSDLIDTPIFGRPVETSWIDYTILVVTASLIGLIFAIRPDLSDPEVSTKARDRDDNRTIWGGFVSFLAVGCPVCNQVVVALVGTSGALAWWAPVQPVIGLLAVALLLYTLRKRLRTFRLVACPVPASGRRKAAR